MIDQDYIKILERLDQEHIAAASAIFADSEAANKFEMYCLKHHYVTSSYTMRTEDGIALTKVVYWKKD